MWRAARPAAIVIHAVAGGDCHARLPADRVHWYTAHAVVLAACKDVLLEAFDSVHGWKRVYEMKKQRLTYDVVRSGTLSGVAVALVSTDDGGVSNTGLSCTVVRASRGTREEKVGNGGSGWFRGDMRLRGLGLRFVSGGAGP